LWFFEVVVLARNQPFWRVIIMDRVVITGMGTVNPIGMSVAESWKNALAGYSSAGPITLFDASKLSVNVVCEVKGFDPANYMDSREARRRDRYQQLACAAAKEAIENSGLDIRANAERVGVVVSASIGGLRTLEEAIHQIIDQGARKLSPFTIPMLMGNGASGLISIDYGAKGPSFSIASACASGADAIGNAWRLIRNGEVDAVVAGGSDATICEVGIGAFDRVGAMTRSNSYEVPRPFDKDRDGLVMGEGSAVLVLERESFAKKRGAKILAELAGYGTTSDAYHVTAPSEDGGGGARAIRMALDVAGLTPQDTDYINAHGTGTVLNDHSETKAIKLAFGELAYKIPISSTKSMTGHIMGTTGALEAIFSVMTIQSGMIAPTIHYKTPDPLCDLDYVPNVARKHPVKVVVSNAFGFGGHNAVLAFRAWEE
jgi:3-oxoacyl-[acyl-carrier-protein] synthase II